jgi:hypothetical protein
VLPLSGSRPGERGSLCARFCREVLPDPRGLVSFSLLVSVVFLYLSLEPDRQGRLFGRLLAHLPAALRGPSGDATLEALAQEFLLVGPAIALYAASRRLYQRKSLGALPYLTAGGGALLTLLTAVGLLLQCF